MPRILQGYIFRELIMPFGISMLVATFILLAGKIMHLVQMVVDWGVNPLEVGKFILFIIPTFLGFTIPMAVVLAVLVGFGRLSADGELTAMKSSGISLYQMLRPVAAFSAGAMALSFYFMVAGLPWGTTGFRELLFEIARKRIDLGIQEQVFNDSFRGLVLYVSHMERQTGKLQGILISDSRDMNVPATIMAREGRIFADPESLTMGLLLQDGSIHRMEENNRCTETVQFQQYQLRMELEEKFTERQRSKKKIEQMDLLELWQKLNDPELENRQRAKAGAVLHQKAAIPVACLIMSILAIPLGIMWSAAGRFQGFALGALVIMSYYTFLLMGDMLVTGEKVPPFLGIWFPNVLFGALALYLLKATAEEREIRIVTWVNGQAVRLRAWLERLSQ